MILTGIGIPGSGKTCYAVRKALEYMAGGGAVFSNIRLNGVVEREETAGMFEHFNGRYVAACSLLGDCREKADRAESDFKRLSLIAECGGGVADLAKAEAARVQCESLESTAKELEGRFASVKKEYCEYLFARFELSESSNVRKVLKRDFGWNYCPGQYHYIDLDTMDESFLSAVPRGSASKRILLILDEVNEWFDSLDTGLLKSKDAKGERYREMFKFLRLSRHYHIDVLFLLQDFSTLNVRLRGLCGGLIKTTDMQKMRVPGVPFCFPFPWFLIQEYDKTGKHCLHSTTWPKEKSIFSCYDSFCEFGSVSLSAGSFNSDFRGKGKEEKKKGLCDMNNLERIGIAAGFVAVMGFSGGWWGGGARAAGVRTICVTNVVERVVGPSGGAGGGDRGCDVLPRVTCEYAPYSWIEFGSREPVKFALLKGTKLYKGDRTEWGLLVEADERYLRFVNEDGREHFIYKVQGIMSDAVVSDDSDSRGKKSRVSVKARE